MSTNPTTAKEKALHEKLEVQTADLMRHVGAIGQIVKYETWFRNSQHRAALVKRLREVTASAEKALALAQETT